MAKQSQLARMLETLRQQRAAQVAYFDRAIEMVEAQQRLHAKPKQTRPKLRMAKAGLVNVTSDPA